MFTKQEKLQKLFPEDLYLHSNNLNEGEVDVLVELEAAMEKHIRPLLTEYTEKAEFPTEAFKKVTNEVQFFSDERLFSDDDEEQYLPSQYYLMFLYQLLASIDTSIATFVGVHAGLGYYSFLLGGSEEQKKEWLPKLQRFELQTCFGLTEPDHGSDIAGGLETTATKKGDKWIINGEKRWIGGAGTADLLPIYARDTEDGKIKCFIIEKGQPGLRVDKIENKIALRMVQNGHIHLENVEVSEKNRLPKINGFKDVAKILYVTRSMVAVIATGLTIGAYRSALDYTTNRKQFGKSIASYQLIQEKLSRIISNISSQISLNASITDLQSKGEFDEVRASVGKLQNSLLMRQSVSYAREICGGNGIVLDYNTARFFQDAEAIYTYEGTHEVNSLVIGRSLTGKSAFV